MKNIPTGTWVVVADGGGARMFRNTGNAGELSLKQERIIEPQSMSDGGPAGRQPPETRGSHQDEATFAKQLALQLNDAALKNEFGHLVLMADPQTLGQIRPLLHDQTLQRMVGEVAKTFTNSPVADIERALQ